MSANDPSVSVHGRQTGHDWTATNLMDSVTDAAIEEAEEAQLSQISSEEENSSLQVAVLVFLVASALVIGRLLHRRRVHWLPESGATILIGFAVGLVVHYIAPIASANEKRFYFDPEFFSLFLLPPIIFESGFSLNQTLFFERFGSICTFAVVGTLISTGLMWVLIYQCGQFGLIYHLSKVEAGAFAALISAVDPVATLATFSSLQVDPELHNLVFGESVLNDAVSIVLFRSILDFYLDDFYAQMHLPRVFLSFALIASGSVLIGFTFALAAGLTFKWLGMAHHADADTAVVECALFWAFSYLSFVVAELFGMSGIVATLFAGIFMARYVPPNLTRAGLELTSEALRTLAMLADTMVFMLVGMAIVVYNAENVTHIPFFLVAFGGCIVTRALNIFPLAYLLNYKKEESARISKPFQVVMWFSGLRGAIAVALAVQLPGPRKGPLVVDTMLIVVASILLLGGGSKTLLDCLKIRTGGVAKRDRELLRLAGSHRRMSGISLGEGDDDGLSPSMIEGMEIDSPRGSAESPTRRTVQDLSQVPAPRRGFKYTIRALEQRFVLHYVVDRTIPGHHDAWSHKSMYRESKSGSYTDLATMSASVTPRNSESDMGVAHAGAAAAKEQAVPSGASSGTGSAILPGGIPA